MKIPNKITIYIDGGARGNPGPAALGVLFLGEKGELLEKYSQYIGEKTNNEAEYLALVFALKKAKALFGKEKIENLPIELKSDSELLIKQMKGEYKIKKPTIQNLFLQAWNLKISFKNLKFYLVSREKNKMADRLVNEALDSEIEIDKRKLF